MNSIFLFYHHRHNITALASFIVLCIGIVGSVFYIQQIQDTRSRASGDLKLLVPIYPSNSATWDQAAATIPPAGSVLILSMGSSQFDGVEGGPGTGPNSQMVQRIRNAHANGWKVIGYVRTQPFPGAAENQRRNASFVRGDIDNFKSWYPEIDGIFYDEVIGNLDYYKSLIAYGRGKFPGNLHILNPGWKISFEALATAADVTVIFEGTYNLMFQLDGFYRNYSTDRWAMLAMNVSDINVCKQVINQAKNQNIGWLYCLQRVGGPNDNPWPVLPSYFAQMAVEMRGANPTTTKTPTTTPTPTSSTPQEPTTKTTEQPTQNPTTTPSLTPTGVVSLIQQPSPSKPPQNSSLALTLFLHGIGKSGDSANPKAVGNQQPKTTQRSVNLILFNSNNTEVARTQGTVIFNATEGNFIGTIAVNEQLSEESYAVKVQIDKYLVRQVPGTVNLILGKTTEVESLDLIVGDVNSDNRLNVLDYNEIIDCYAGFKAARNCSTEKKSATDLDDDGKVDLYDYNLFIRELSVFREGE